MNVKRTVSQKPLYELISPEYFTPRGLNDLPTPSTTQYRIPEHQRFPAWPLYKKQLLVDSVLRNYPIHAVIVIRRIDMNEGEVDEYSDVEDGQTRMTALQEYFLDKYPCESGANSVGLGKKFSELPSEMQQRFKNYSVTLEIFEGRSVNQDVISEIFNRLNSGKPLGDNDKFYSRKTTPVIKYLFELQDREFRVGFSKYVGSVGSGKTRTGLKDMVGAILAIATKHYTNGGGQSCITTSYERNQSYLKIELTAQQKTDIKSFFETYFAMLGGVLDTLTSKPKKKYGKLSGVLGLSVSAWIKYGNIPEYIPWYVSKLFHNPKYVPNTFSELTKGEIRNCQHGEILRRLEKIKEQYEQDPNGGEFMSDESDTEDDDN